MAAADKVFVGDIVTMNEDAMSAEAVAVQDGRIIRVGSLDDVKPVMTPSTVTVELGSSTMLPGLIEPHTHPETAAVAAGSVDINGFDPLTVEEAWQQIRDEINRTAPGEWVLIFGVNPILVDGMDYPKRDQLDEVSPKNPIFLIACNLHISFVNSLALQKAGVTEDTPDPPGGSFGRDENGRLNGKVVESSAAEYFLVCLPERSKDEMRALLMTQINSYASHGFTTVTDMGTEDTFPFVIELHEELVNRADCPIRMVLYKNGEKYKAGQKPPQKPGVDNLYTGGIKLWADGSPYAGTMACEETYLDTKMTRDKLQFGSFPCYGKLIYDKEGLRKHVESRHKEGWQMAVHAHGDTAIKQCLEVFEEILTEHPREDHRHRLDHCGLITRQQLAWAARLGVTVTIYIDHIYYYGRALRDSILGPERAARFMPLNSAKQEQHKFTIHADSPCSPLAIFRVIKTAVTRETRREPTDGPDYTPDVVGPAERVSVLDALKACTINAAWQLFHEDVIGSIEVGKIADFTVVSANPLRAKPDDLDKIKVLKTYKNGKEATPFKI